MTASAECQDVLSIHAATRWLKARGVHPSTQHSVYAAIAHQQLHVAAIAQRMVFIRVADLAKYANELERQNANGAKSKG